MQPSLGSELRGLEGAMDLLGLFTQLLESPSLHLACAGAAVNAAPDCGDDLNACRWHHAAFAPRLTGLICGMAAAMKNGLFAPGGVASVRNKSLRFCKRSAGIPLGNQVLELFDARDRSVAVPSSQGAHARLSARSRRSHAVAFRPAAISLHVAKLGFDQWWLTAYRVGKLNDQMSRRFLHMATPRSNNALPQKAMSGQLIA